MAVGVAAALGAPSRRSVTRLLWLRQLGGSRSGRGRGLLPLTLQARRWGRRWVLSPLLLLLQLAASRRLPLLTSGRLETSPQACPLLQRRRSNQYTHWLGLGLVVDSEPPGMQVCQCRLRRD